MDKAVYILTKERPEPAADLPNVPGSSLAFEGPKETGYGEIPAGISLLWPDLCWLSVLSANPAPSPDASRSFYGFAERIAHTCDGIVYDADGVPLKEFAEPVALPRVTETTPLIGLSVFFPADPRLISRRREAMALFSERLPYLLPERYGARVPPENEFGGNTAEFYDFLDECPSPVVYPRLPVTNLFFRESGGPGGEAGDVGCVSFFLPEAVWNIPSWKYALCETLSGLARIYGAFFGRISADEQPAARPSFRGIPYELGNAALFGPPYFDLISGKENGKITGEKTVLFVEPDGPSVPDELITGKPSFFGKLFRSVKPAAVIPDGCGAPAVKE